MYQKLKQVEEAARSLADYIKRHGAAASVVVIQAQSKLIAARAEEVYCAVLGDK